MCSFHSLEIGIVCFWLPQYFLGIFDNGKDHPGTWDSNIIPAVLTHTFLIVVNVFKTAFVSEFRSVMASMPSFI